MKIRETPSFVMAGALAARWALYGPGAIIQSGDAAILEPWADIWSDWSCSVFFKAYLRAADSGLLPAGPAAVATLLRTLLLESALRQLGRELLDRPAWARIPLEGVLQLLDAMEE